MSVRYLCGELICQARFVEDNSPVCQARCVENNNPVSQARCLKNNSPICHLSGSVWRTTARYVRQGVWRTDTSGKVGRAQQFSMSGKVDGVWRTTFQYIRCKVCGEQQWNMSGKRCMKSGMSGNTCGEQAVWYIRQGVQCSKM